MIHANIADSSNQGKNIPTLTIDFGGNTIM